MITTNGSTPPQPAFGLTLSSEEHCPRRLVDIAVLAEQSGFDFVSISDHFHPWIDEQGHSPFVWGVLGAIAARTESIEVAVGVTCPTVRIHPAILAQATATAANLLSGRFVWGVGTGEALNEHILGHRWPPAPVRLAMLREAVDVVRQMWRGDEFSTNGEFYRVENARIYDPPEAPVPIVVSAFGPIAADLAAEIGDGLWTGADADIIERYRSAGGEGPVYSQMTLSWHEDRREAIDRAHRIWPNTGVPGQLSQDLPTPTHFEQAAELVTEDLVASSVPCGNDVDAIVRLANEAIAAGVDHLYFHQIGDDQEAFCHAWKHDIEPKLSAARVDA
jgi:G6PDH family F420-dependent oxidoreductase